MRLNFFDHRTMFWSPNRQFQTTSAPELGNRPPNRPPPTSATELQRPPPPTSTDLNRPPTPTSADLRYRPPPTSATDLRYRPPQTYATDLHRFHPKAVNAPIYGRVRVRIAFEGITILKILCMRSSYSKLSKFAMFSLLNLCMYSLLLREM